MLYEVITGVVVGRVGEREDHDRLVLLLTERRTDERLSLLEAPWIADGTRLVDRTDEYDEFVTDGECLSDDALVSEVKRLKSAYVECIIVAH